MAARCAATIALASNGGAEDSELEPVIEDVLRLPDGQMSSRLAAGLILTLVKRGPAASPYLLRHLDDLLAAADRHPPEDPGWERLRSAVLSLSTLHGAAFGARDVPDPHAAVQRLQELALANEADPAMHQALSLALSGMKLGRDMTGGDISVVRGIPAEVERLRDWITAGPVPATSPDLGVMWQALGHVGEILAANQRDDHDGAADAMRRLRESIQALPPDHFLRVTTESTTAGGELLFAMWRQHASNEPVTPPSDEQFAALVELAERPGLDPNTRASACATVGLAALAGGEGGDPNRLRIGVDFLRRALDSSPSGHPLRPVYLQCLAMGLYRLSEVTGSIAELDAAVELLEEARGLLGGPGSHHWSMVNETLSMVQRRRGHIPESRRSALDSLRTYALQAIAQPDDHARRIAVKNAVNSAVDAARWCLTDNDVAEALRMLDTGRGLILFAATEAHEVHTRLHEAGHPELARQWREAIASGDPDAMTSDLRRQVLATLSDVGNSGLLDPPGLPEIRSALRTLDADALVYLLSGEDHVAGWAVIAPAQGPPSYMVLPGLGMKQSLDVENYLSALAARGEALRDARDLHVKAADARLAGSLDALCDWAWRAAIGPLLQRCIDELPAPTSGRVRRIFLVAMGDLARIPWQAARRADGTYAVQLAAFSQIASARMLCDVAKRQPVRPTSNGLVVGDPDAGGGARQLFAARVEAHAIHQTFYRGARYLGRRPDGSPSPSGAGTVQAVSDWLTTTHPAAGAVLHLACHGDLVSDPDSPRAYLQLAREDGRPTELSAGELIGIMARNRDRAIGLVVLAACHTGRSIHGYDEAYSLGTAFLAGGARSVLSTQWSVPDVATSALMFMFHHYLRHEGRPAWQALREAQLWMLDPARRAPDHMPSALRPRLTDTDPAHVVAWAGFVHWGQ